MAEPGDDVAARPYGSPYWLGGRHADADRVAGVHRADGLAGPTRRYLLIVGLLAGTASLPILATISADSATTIGHGRGGITPFIDPLSDGPAVVVPPPLPRTVPPGDQQIIGLAESGLPGDLDGVLLAGRRTADKSPRKGDLTQPAEKPKDPPKEPSPPKDSPTNPPPKDSPKTPTAPKGSTPSNGPSLSNGPSQQSRSSPTDKISSSGGSTPRHRLKGRPVPCPSAGQDRLCPKAGRTIPAVRPWVYQRRTR